MPQDREPGQLLQREGRHLCGRRGAAPAGYHLVVVAGQPCFRGVHRVPTIEEQIPPIFRSQAAPGNTSTARCLWRVPLMPSRIAALVAERAERAAPDAALVEGRTGQTVTWGDLAGRVAEWTARPELAGRAVLLQEEHP